MEEGVAEGLGGGKLEVIGGFEKDAVKELLDERKRLREGSGAW